MSTPSTRRAFLAHASLAAGPLLWARYPPKLLAKEGPPDPARATIDGSRLRLANAQIQADWDLASGLRLLEFRDLARARALPGPLPVFVLTLRGAGDTPEAVPSSALALAGPPQVLPLPADPRSACFAARLSGRQIVARFHDPARRFEVAWSAQLRDGSHYIRQEISITAAARDLPLFSVALFDGPLPSAALVGRVKGSPLAAGPADAPQSFFLGFEHPLSSATVAAGYVHAALALPLPLAAGHAVTYSSVIGAAPDGQLRRAFLQYLERERAHPYRPFLHYNSWYDLGYFTPYDQAGALDVIQTFGRELHQRRGVALDSFLFDDGWDDHQLWGFNPGFPNGFAPLDQAAARIGAAPGVWLSPWGGYGKPRAERLAYGAQHGFETNAQGFALSGPVYYQRFRQVCLDMVHRYGVNQFKIDGTGSSSTVVPGSAFGSDFEAAISLIGDLRAAQPSLFVNLTTGTYPSPFWLRYADSTWRGGGDHDFAGVGSSRQQWITYRDAQTFKNVVQRGPLYPLNSLMLHGMIYARYADKLDTDPGGDFDAEIRAYFGTGTQLQEMYISHALLSPHNWDKLAESARWARRNAAALVDSHWVGGDPAQLEPYGHAAWSPGKAILTLRNPSDRPQTLKLDPAAAFELPDNAPERWRARSPYPQDQWQRPQSAASLELRAGDAHAFELQPFEVLTLEATPA